MKHVMKRRSVETISEEARLQEVDERHFLSQQIFFRREGLDWSQEDLARASGLTQSQVATIEAGQANPTLRTLVKLATALSCSVSELLVAERSPLDIPGINVDVSTGEIVAFVREGRERA